MVEWSRLLSEKHFIDHDSDICRNDYDQIICSTLFRRLQDKAQVFPLEQDDYVRTRLTHSLEVSAIGKKLGEYVFDTLKDLQKDPWFALHTEKSFSDVLLCAGLIHDIGNPPFGHFGEYAIREWFQMNLNQLRLGERKVCELLSQWQIQDLCSFEGNAQSLRLLSGTPYLGKTDGFDLSYRVLGTIMKYPVSSADRMEPGKSNYKKIGYYFAERELFDDMDADMGLNGARHPLSYLLEAADDIAYRTSDLEDALVKKVISFQQIADAFQAYITELDATDACKNEVETGMSKLSELYQEELKKESGKPGLTAVQRWNRYIQNAMIHDAGRSFVSHYDRIMAGTFFGDLFDETVSGHIIRAIAELCERLVYTNSIKTRTELFGRRVIRSLLDQFMPAAIKYDTGEMSTFIEQRTMDTVSDFYKSMYHSRAAGKNEDEKLYLRMLMITDYISGMTDHYAKRLYQELFA